MRFEFATSSRIIVGRGTVRDAGSIAATFGRDALVITGRDRGRAEPLLDRLHKAGIATTLVPVAHEPTTTDITAGTERARAARCDVVIGFGGGAALDAAKAIAALIPNSGDLMEYLEVIGRAQPLPHASIPCIAIPTTAGTGSEVTRNAVLSSPAHRVKVSLRSPHMLPRVALVDPELTYSLPPAITAFTGMDALTQLIEPYVSVRANPMTDPLCVDGIRRVAPALRRVVEDGRDAAAREEMALASLFGGLALANAGLGAVHGFAGPIGGMFPAPHGAVCAALLAFVMDANLAALRSRTPGSSALSRYDEVARLLTGRAHATADDGVAWIRTLVANLAIPTLGTYGITPADSSAIVEAAAKSSSMKANPVTLTAPELDAILIRAL